MVIRIIFIFFPEASAAGAAAVEAAGAAEAFALFPVAGAVLVVWLQPAIEVAAIAAQSKIASNFFFITINLP
jgi:hypothetical protein